MDDSQGYEFEFNGCRYWTDLAERGQAHYRQLYIMGKLVDHIPQQLLTPREYENARVQVEML